MLFKLPDADFSVAEIDEWTPQGVIAALVEAYQVLDDCSGRIGPRKLKAFWPEYRVEFGDLTAQAEIGSAERRRPRRRPSSIQIARMEMALLGWRDAAGTHPAWLNGPLRSYERPRKCLAAFVMAKHHGVTEVLLCQRMGWALATFKRHKLAGATLVARQLNRSGVPTFRR